MKNLNFTMRIDSIGDHTMSTAQILFMTKYADSIPSVLILRTENREVLEAIKNFKDLNLYSNVLTMNNNDEGPNENNGPYNEDTYIHEEGELTMHLGYGNLPDGILERISGKSAPQVNIYIFYKKENLVVFDKLAEHLKQFLGKTAVDPKKSKVDIITSSSYGYTTKTMLFDKPEIDFDLNYNSNAKELKSKIEEYLVKKKAGLILIEGPPGTGKSTFIKHLISDKKAIYVPNASASSIANPDFIDFITDHPETLFIFEDAESVLTKQDGATAAISNILNMTDGILGDFMSSIFICTVNSADNIDPAVLRFGRLISHEKFDRLPVEQATALSAKLGLNIQHTEPSTLADIYAGKTSSQKKKIGF